MGIVAAVTNKVAIAVAKYRIHDVRWCIYLPGSLVFLAVSDGPSGIYNFWDLDYTITPFLVS